MGHILGPKSDLSTATLVTFLLAVSMEISDCECGPFPPFLAVFVILGQVGNPMCQWGKGPSQE